MTSSQPCSQRRRSCNNLANGHYPPSAPATPQGRSPQEAAPPYAGHWSPVSLPLQSAPYGVFFQAPVQMQYQQHSMMMPHMGSASLTPAAWRGGVAIQRLVTAVCTSCELVSQRLVFYGPSVQPSPSFFQAASYLVLKAARHAVQITVSRRTLRRCRPAPGRWRTCSPAWAPCRC